MHTITVATPRISSRAEAGGRILLQWYRQGLEQAGVKISCPYPDTIRTTAAAVAGCRETLEPLAMRPMILRRTGTWLVIPNLDLDSGEESKCDNE